MHRRRLGLCPALFALVLLPLGACNDKGHGAGPAPTAVTPAPAPAPAGLLADLFVPAPGALWGKLKGSLGPPAVFLPQSFGGLVTTLVNLPITMAAEVDDAVPVVGAAVRQGSEYQATVGVHVKAGDRFIDQLTRGEGARCDVSIDKASGVALLTDKVAPDAARAAIGVLGNYLLIAAKPADLFALGPYVARTLPAATMPKDDVALEVSEASLTGPVVDMVRDLRGQAEGAAATLVSVTGLLDSVISLLSDARHARVALSFDAAAARARLTLSPKPGAGEELARDLTVGDVKPLLELPDTTTLGLLWRESSSSRDKSAPRQAEALAKRLGPAATADDREAIAAALRAEAQARGDYQAVGVAFNGTGPTAVVRAPATDPEAMREALERLVALGDRAVIKKAFADAGLKLTSGKTVVENVEGGVVRVRLARVDVDEATPKKGAPGTASAIDLLYLVNKDGLFAAGGYDPKDSLRGLVRAPSGSNLASIPAMAGALAGIGSDASFVLVADALRMNAMTTGVTTPAAPAPVVLAAGRTAAPLEVWGRLDVPVVVVQRVVGEHMQRRSAPANKGGP